MAAPEKKKSNRNPELGYQRPWAEAETLIVKQNFALGELV